jgi:hypothetical protein
VAPARARLLGAGYGEGHYEHERVSKTFGTVSPPLRHTVALFPHGWTALRFVPDNPGVWAFHYHIEPHLHLGMSVQGGLGGLRVRTGHQQGGGPSRSIVTVPVTGPEELGWIIMV